MTHLALCRIELSNGDSANALPCPYCAAAADLSLRVDYDGRSGVPVLIGHAVLCETCGASGPYHEDEEGALAAWNTRYFYQDSPDAPAALSD